MINFIAVDDNNKFLEIIVNTITKVMMKNKFIYKTHSFSEYDEKFFKLMNSNLPNKIYIMDIETRQASGIDVARKIRKNDVDSIIIFATVHNEAGLILLKDDLMFLNFICKFDDFENKLRKSINKALEFINHRPSIKFSDSGSLYNILIKDILYICKEDNDRKCTINTSYSKYKVNLTLKELNKLCNNCLRQSHRSCFVNMDRVRTIDKHKNIIEFDNGEKINMLSSLYKKELSICD